MATFEDIQDRMASRLKDESNTSVRQSELQDAINDAVRYWKKKIFWFNTDTFTDTLTAQDGEIPLPSDFLIPVRADDAFWISYSSIRYPLTKVSEEQYNSMYLANGFGLPRVYTQIDGIYQSYPLPDQDYTISGHYLKDYDDLVNDNDTNDFTVYADRLIMLWALANCFAEYRQDDKLETYYRAAALDEEKSLRAFTNRKRSSGRLQTGSYLM